MSTETLKKRMQDAAIERIATKERADRWAAQYGLKKSESIQGWKALVKAPYRRPSPESPRYYAGLPGDDHCDLWNKDGKPHCWVSQPYHLDADDCKRMAMAAEEYGLDFYISTYPAYYFPGHVLFVIWTRKGEYLKPVSSPQESKE